MDIVQFEKGKQRAYLRQIKSTLNLSWDQIAHDLNISKFSLYGYLREDRDLPVKIYDYFSKIYSNKFSHTLAHAKNSPRSITLPPLSEHLAEFLGALAGDGHLRIKHPAMICIVTHKITDCDYLLHLSKLFSDLFHYQPTIAFQKNTIRLKFYSIELAEKLSTTYQLPAGKKKHNLHIPQQILHNRMYLLAYLRGLFDTDGSFTRHHKSTRTHKESGGIVEICSLDRPFLLEVDIALRSLGFTTSVGDKNVKVYSRKEIDWFFALIGSSNPKHLFKYWYYRRYGTIPLTIELTDSFVHRCSILILMHGDFIL